MVFANLGSGEKDAFFELLDEYFASRPEIFAHITEDASTAAVQTPPTISWKNPSPNTANRLSDYDAIPSIGRVAAAAAALRFNASPAQTSSVPSTSPRPPPRRAPSSIADASEESEHSEQLTHIERSTSKLIQQKKFGDVDLSSGKNMFSSLRNSTANKSAVPPPVAPPVPSAFAQKKNAFAPPPTRRMPSSSPSVESVETRPQVRATPPLPNRQPPPSAAEEEGEWVEALYEYSSDDPGDLQLREGDRVLVVEKSSEDWWKGELDGREGLFPASYVQAI